MSLRDTLDGVNHSDYKETVTPPVRTDLLQVIVYTSPEDAMGNEKTQQVGMRLPGRLVRRLDQLAEKQRRSRSNMVVLLLEQAISESEAAAEAAQ